MKHLIWILAITLLLIGCGSDSDDSDTNTNMPSSQLLLNGWAKFETGDYTSGKQCFETVVARGDSLDEAYCGLGWCQARAYQLDAAVTSFTTGLSTSTPNDTTYCDLAAGLGFAQNAQTNYQASIDALALLFAQSSSWTFLHDSSLDTNDLLVLNASNYYGLGNFLEALELVQTIDESFTADVNTPAGRAALAAEIERLGGHV